MKSHWHDFVYLFVGIIIPTYNICAWIGRTFGKFLRRIFIRTERDAIVFAHRKYRAMKQGHRPKGVVECQDGECAKI